MRLNLAFSLSFGLALLVTVFQFLVLVPKLFDYRLISIESLNQLLVEIRGKWVKLFGLDDRRRLGFRRFRLRGL